MRDPPRPFACRAATAYLLAATLAGCAPEASRVEVSDAARDAPAPALVPTARFAAALDRGAADVVRLDADRAALAARAAALEARAAALSAAPVIEPGDRERLEAATAAP